MTMDAQGSAYSFWRSLFCVLQLVVTVMGIPIGLVVMKVRELFDAGPPWDSSEVTDAYFRCFFWCGGVTLVLAVVGFVFLLI